MDSNSFDPAILAFEIKAKSTKGEACSELGAAVFQARGILARRVFLIYLNFNTTAFLMNKQLGLLLALESGFIAKESERYVDPTVAAEVLEVPLRVIKRFIAHLKNYVGFESEK